MGLRLRLHRQRRHSAGTAARLPRPVHRRNARKNVPNRAARRALRPHRHSDTQLQLPVPGAARKGRGLHPAPRGLENAVHPRPAVVLLHRPHVCRIHRSLDIANAQRHHPHVGHRATRPPRHRGKPAARNSAARHTGRHAAARHSRRNRHGARARNSRCGPRHRSSHCGSARHRRELRLPEQRHMEPYGN